MTLRTTILPISVYTSVSDGRQGAEVIALPAGMVTPSGGGSLVLHWSRSGSRIAGLYKYSAVVNDELVTCARAVQAIGGLLL